jgi:hypothetical protein
MKKQTYIVYLEWINYEGKVTERDEIARFVSREWAETFIENCTQDDNFSRVVIEEK